MAEKTKGKTRKALKKRPGKTVTSRKRVQQGGLNMDDLVGTITISIDPVEYQRSIRNEW